jgi:hypothetical protein
LVLFIEEFAEFSQVQPITGRIQIEPPSLLSGVDFAADPQAAIAPA